MKVLTEEAEQDRYEFMEYFEEFGCSCHLYPPCSYCTHPGNPINQDDDDSCWMEV